MQQDQFLKTIHEDRSDTSSIAPGFVLPNNTTRGPRSPSEVSNVANSVRNGPRSEAPSSVGAILPGSTIIPETAQSAPSKKRACERFLKRNLVLILVGCILVTGVIIAIVVVATAPMDDPSAVSGPEAIAASPNIPTTSPLLNFPTSRPSLRTPAGDPLNTVPPPETIALLDATLRTVTPDYDNLTLNQTSHYYQARQWMLFQDLLREDVIREGSFWVIQRYVLVLFYYSLNGDQWFDSDNETFLIRDTSECQWAGVSCSEDDEAVITLHMPFNNLTGTLPSELGHLSKLQWLNLTDNYITGTISTTVFDQMRSLYHVDLSKNNITGLIPPSLWSIPSLKTVDLSDNLLEGPFELFANSSPAMNLTEIRLSNNFLVGSLPSWLSELPELTHLEAVNSNFSGRLPDPIPPALEHFNVYWNTLTGKIPGSYFGSASLVYLYLDFNELTGTLPAIDPPRNNSLSHLFLHNNQLSGEIPESFGYEWTNLQKLFLHNNSALTGSLGPADETLCTTIWPQFEKMKSDCKGNLSTVICPCCFEC
ncbi:hypothetical protein FisN_7Lh180 [Fistulifera solaris]|uniref:L domain-like protein n=1 Tax=Fistulifera solaris TaxID=1519565 RepID=A0A1Z5JCS4_FISSO|nr:hypothetical protein FisN_7Lh180 [Fistulifera solaris]|eukprot:GAX11797.1 hypothetical protein FisN_7Lh180 [Fistulifera solaris]